MSYTNHTTHYELPQWVRDDKPTFLSDMNGAFDKIDRALHDNASAIADEGLEVDRVEAKVDGYGDRLDTVEVKVGALETAQTGLDGRITHNSNDINTINSLIGNGEPTTQDKTIIGAINELAEEITGDPRVDALVEEVGNTPLDTTANTLTGAVNEVNTKAVNAQASANTANSKADANANKIGAETMTTTAQTLTGAINELNAKPSGGGAQKVFERTYNNTTLNAVSPDITDVLDTHSVDELVNAKIGITTPVGQFKVYNLYQKNPAGYWFNAIDTSSDIFNRVELFVSKTPSVSGADSYWVEYSVYEADNNITYSRNNYAMSGLDSQGNISGLKIAIYI